MSMILSLEQVRLAGLIVGITILSGIGDAHGFVHAARVWQNDVLVWEEMAKSALGFAFGISLHWLIIRYLNAFGMVAPEAQTLLWFSVTMIGIAALSGRFSRWQTIDQVVATGVLLGVGWLLLRVGE